MKMIIAIVHDTDNEPVSHALVSNGFHVTRIASSGGFLRRGQSTLMIGVEEEKLNDAIQVIRESTTPASDAGMKRATLFVLNIELFSQI
jgi:uncharacterized protein YaaQ